MRVSDIHYLHNPTKLITKEELKVLLKNFKKEYTVWKCKDCPLYHLQLRKEVGCTTAINLLCGKEPVNCLEATILLNKFIIEIKKNNNQNKI